MKKLFLVLLVFLSFPFASLHSQEISVSEEKLNRLTQILQELKLFNLTLQSNLERLMLDSQTLDSQYQALVQEYQKLMLDYQNLEKIYKDSEQDYLKLKNLYENLQQEFSKLKQSFQELQIKIIKTTWKDRLIVAGIGAGVGILFCYLIDKLKISQ